MANFQFTICPNPKCRQQTIVARVFNYDPNTRATAGLLHEWRLVPESEAKPFPDFIPVQLLDDYREACLIRNKSPKASATLSRRCLQGMIRDFWGIAKGRLIDEVNALQSRVDAQTWKAIDAVRKVGNIGAHMEKDVNLIVDVEPEEASLLIWLIETLFEDWYVERHEKNDKMNKLIALAGKKNSPPKDKAE